MVQSSGPARRGNRRPGGSRRPGAPFDNVRRQGLPQAGGALDTKSFLRGTTLFASCSDKELDGILSASSQRSFATGDVIVREGHPGGQGFYLILSGAAEVRKGGDAVDTMGPGDFFGEMALLLEETPRTADVVATEPTTCLVMTRWEFKSLLEGHADIAQTIMLELASRLRDAGGRVSA